MTDVVTTGNGGLDLDARWELHPQVALRPESFGALLYHFGTRKLSFLKNRVILEIIASLPDQPDLRTAIAAAAVEEKSVPRYVSALSALSDSQMIVRSTI